jgi:hypothetical protein
MLPISSLIIDERIADIVEKNHGSIKKYEKSFQYMETFPLSQERLNLCMKIREPLAPISVSKSGSKYIVLNGRHRIACAILKGQSTILASVVN